MTHKESCNAIGDLSTAQLQSVQDDAVHEPDLESVQQVQRGAALLAWHHVVPSSEPLHNIGGSSARDVLPSSALVTTADCS